MLLKNWSIFIVRRLHCWFDLWLFTTFQLCPCLYPCFYQKLNNCWWVRVYVIGIGYGYVYCYIYRPVNKNNKVAAFHKGCLFKKRRSIPILCSRSIWKISWATPLQSKWQFVFVLRLWTDRSLHITVHSQDLDKQAIYLSLGQHWSELSGQTIANVHSFWETFFTGMAPF